VLKSLPHSGQRYLPLTFCGCGPSLNLLPSGRMGSWPSRVSDLLGVCVAKKVTIEVGFTCGFMVFEASNRGQCSFIFVLKCQFIIRQVNGFW
jgi:hypothetical protein